MSKIRLNGVRLDSNKGLKAEQFNEETRAWEPAKPTGGSSIASFAASVVIVDSEEEATDPNILYLIREEDE